MKYIYAAMLLHSAEKEVNEKNVEAVVSAAGVEIDKGQVKALVEALKDVNIEEAIAEASVAAAPVAAAPAASSEAPAEEKKEEPEEKGKTEEEAAEGLGSLFG